MQIEIQPGVRLFVDFDGPQYVIDGAQLREKPTLLLVHGGPGYDHSSFRSFFARLRDLVHIVYFDLRSHGRSSPRPAEEWTLDVFADDIVRLSEALGLVKPIVLGQSFGGFVVQRYLARHAAHPAKAILSSTSHHYALERKIAGFGRLGGPEAEAAARDFWSRPNEASWAVYDRVCRALYNTTPQDPLGAKRLRFRPDILFHSAGGEQRQMDLRPGLAGVQCPVLLMAGEQDPVTPIEDAEEIAAALPAQWLQFARFPGVGHGPWRDDPEATERVLRAFLS